MGRCGEQAALLISIDDIEWSDEVRQDIEQLAGVDGGRFAEQEAHQARLGVVHTT